MRRSGPWPFAFAIALATLSRPAPAEPRDPVRADALFREGRDAMKQRDYEIACARFGESQSLDPAPGTLLNLADCEEKLGRVAAAYRHVQGALADLPARDDRARIAKERLGALEKRLAMVTLRVARGTPVEARVSRDGADVAPSDLGAPQAMDPGQHVFALLLPDGREKRTTVTLREGEAREILLELVATPPAPPPLASSSSSAATPLPPPPPSSPPPPARPREIPTSAYVAGGIGAAGLVVSGVTFAVLAHKKSIVDRDCDGSARTCTTDDGVDAARSGKPLVPVFYGAAIVGIAGAATVASILLWQGRDDARAVGVDVGPGTLRLGGRF